MTSDPLSKFVRPSISLPEGVPPLSSLYVYAAGACNLACKHCYISPPYLREGDTASAPKRFLDVGIFEKAVGEALPFGLRSVKFTGGEPLLHPCFRDLVDIAVRHELDIVIETNGTLIDSAMAGFLRDTGRVSCVSISLDGPDVGTHEALRSVAGSFVRAVEGIRHLVREGICPQVICTLHRGNMNLIRETVDLAVALGASSVKFNHLQSMGRATEFGRASGLEVRELLSLKKSADGFSDLPPGFGILFDIPPAFHSIRSILSAQGSNRCTLHNILGLLSDGSAALCGAAVADRDLVWGNLTHESLGGIWTEAPRLAWLRRYVPLELKGICGDCIHRDFCLGACVAETFHVERSLTAPYSFCREADAAALFPPARRRSNDSKEGRSI